MPSSTLLLPLQLTHLYFFILKFYNQGFKLQNSMKPILLHAPPNPTMCMPEIFESGACNVIRRAVVIGNGSPGSENQSIGLVKAIGLSDMHVLYRVTRPRGGINEWLNWLPVSLHKKLDYLLRLIGIYSQRQKVAPLPSENGAAAGVGLASVLEADVKSIVSMARETYKKHGPLLVVASGRDTISVASSIKRLASEIVFVVQIQHPRSQLNRFDLVITPRHDFDALSPQAQQQIPRFLQRWITPREPPDRNVFLTLGTLHQIDTAALRRAAADWHDVFAPLPKPMLVVNIGWPTKNCPYGADLAKQLAASLLSILKSCGTVEITFSSRTAQKLSKIIVKELADNPKVYIWDVQEPNPRMGHLAWGDAFVITADSVSLISDACSTGKPVYVLGAECCKGKLSNFHKSLMERGVVRPFTGFEDVGEIWSYPPLNDTAEAAKWVRQALAERGWRVQP